MSEPLVSAIVMARNKDKYIADCINSLKFSEHKNIEIIVIDNASTDKTETLAKECGVKVINIGTASIPLTYNKGFREAKGDYVFIVGADSTVSKNFLSKAVQLMQTNRRVAIVCGMRVQASTQTIIEKLYQARFDRTNKVGLVSYAAGNQLIRKAAYKKIIGALKESLTANEENFVSDKMIQSGYQIIRICDVSMKHLEDDGALGKYLKKHIWYAKGKASAVAAGYTDVDWSISLMLIGIMGASIISARISLFSMLIIASGIFGKMFLSAKSLNFCDSIKIAAVETVASFVRFFYLLYSIARRPK